MQLLIGGVQALLFARRHVALLVEIATRIDRVDAGCATQRMDGDGLAAFLQLCKRGVQALSLAVGKSYPSARGA